jgi:hypothetical protein
MNNGNKTNSSLFGLSRVCNVVLRVAVMMGVMMVSLEAWAADQYYSLHNKDKGYLKQCKGVVANDATYRYENPYDSNGSSIWVFTDDGYLQCEMYYLNVANGSTLYLSTTKVTQWELVNGLDFRKHFQMVGSSKVLGLDASNKPVLAENPSKKYAACTLTVSDNSWSGPNDLSFTVQSPQLVTYLRTYYTRKITVTITKNDAGDSNKKVVDNKSSREYCSLTFKPGTYGQGTNWDFNTTDGVIYNRTTSDVTAKAHYDILPLNPIVRAAHSDPVDKEITLKITPKAFTLNPDPSIKYLLFNTDNDNYRYPKDNGTLQVNDNLLVNGKNSDLEENASDSYVSWEVECDAEGFLSFKNVKTGRYFYFDATDYTTSDYGALKVGSETLPDDDTKYKYKFRLFSGNVTRSPFGSCCYIIPYEKQFAVYKSDATLEELFFAIYPNRSTNPKIATLTKASDIAKWKIYEYVWENRLWDNFSINGVGGISSTGDYDYTATTWFSRNIVGTPVNAEHCMLGSTTHEGISYTWSVSSLSSYVTYTNAGVNGNGVSTMQASVNSLPPTIVTGTIKVKAQKTPDGETQPLSVEKTLYLTLYNRNPVLTDITQLSQITSENGAYRLTADNTYSATSNHPGVSTFKGILTVATKDDGTFYTIKSLNQPLFTTATNAIISNIMLKEVDIDVAGDAGAIACTANGATRIYNCGILPTSPTNIGANPSTVASSDNKNCGSLVGKLDETARVINCFSYAHITKGGSTNYYVGGLVGNNSKSSSQTTINTVVVNCMFYGDIDAANCANYAPVYGNKPIKNDSDTGINPYDFFREDASFDNNFTTSIDQYVRTWPVKEEYLTRYEYYRSIFNSNRRLCTWWVDGINGTAPTDADVARVGIAKWVLDDSIAPYPILKKWGKYPSIINPDTVKVWDTAMSAWVQRANAKAYQGRIITEMGVTNHPGKLKVTVKAGSNNSSATDKTLYLSITDMDTLHYDYGYAKVQLPYYNEQFGSPTGATHAEKYGNNYTDKVVTGWKVIDVKTKEGYVDTVCFEGPWENDGTRIRYRKNSKAWESGFNFADRKCTSKDLYVTSGRVFAQGGYYYVPEGVTEITIEAYWGKAVYLYNTGRYIDRVKMTNYTADGNVKLGEPFVPAGRMPEKFQEVYSVYTDWREAVKKLDVANLSNNALDLTVYDQAIVLLNNFQIRNENGKVGYDIESKWHPYTLMSVDLDFDNEPDYCFEFQFRRQWDRPGIQPIRFDFLPVPELGMAVRHNQNQNTIGIFIPQGHFEITETSYMHTTQFEYDFGGTKIEAPVILNGGHFEQIVVRRGTNQKTNYFIMGGHFRMLRFTPGAHVTPDNTIRTRHCAVNAIGGDYPEFYLSGIYKADQPAYSDNPHCYTNGGKYGIMAGAGYEKIDGNITFKIDHSIIQEFYGGGINGSKPVTGSIDVSIDNSLVYKYCGGPKVGLMGDGKTVTTKATGTTFTKFYGGGNGGTSYYRQQKQDGNVALPAATAAGWANYGYKIFNPLNTVSGVDPAYEGPGVNSENKGYHALFEFECFVESNGLGENPTVRSYLHWAQFGTTSTGNVTNTLTNCTIKENFYGGGNLANVNGSVSSTLEDCTILGSAFGGGFSGRIEPFRIHNKAATQFPYIDKAGVMQRPNGEFEYVQNENGTDRYFTWCYRKTDTEFFPSGVNIPSTASTNNPTFPDNDGNWHVLTTVSLEGLGAVSNNATITLKGTTTVGTLSQGSLAEGTGNVFGGGNESTVNGNTTVILSEGARVLGNVYGGGNEGPVGGDSKVIIEDAPTISGTTPFTGTTEVTITGPMGSEIHYTIDGSTPTASSTLYSSSFSLNATTTVKAIAITNGVAGPVATKTFTKQ